MNPVIQKLWAEALRSGKYEQGRGGLCAEVDGTLQYCCLGVLCEIAVEQGVALKKKLKANNSREADGYAFTDKSGHDSQEAYLPEIVVEWAGLDSLDPVILKQSDDDGLVNEDTASAVNDDYGYTFDQIADLVDKL